MFETSQTTAKLDAALAKAQGEIEAAAKDKVNPAFRSKYADLTAVWAAIRPALSKHGIAVTQWPLHSEDNRLHMITRLAHDGEWIKGEFSIPVDKQNSHGYGSAVTYAKRFSLAAAVGVVADEDDDGNGAAGKDKAGPHSPDREVTRTNGDTAHLNGTPGASKAKSREGYDALIKEMRVCTSYDAMKEWGKLRRKEIDALPADWMSHFDDAWQEHKDSLTARAA